MNIWDSSVQPAPGMVWDDYLRQWITAPQAPTSTAAPAGDPSAAAPQPTIADPFMGGPQGFTGPVNLAPPPPTIAEAPPPPPAPTPTPTPAPAPVSNSTVLDTILKNLPPPPTATPAPKLPPPPTWSPPKLPPPPALPTYQPPTLAMPELPQLNPIAPMPFEGSKETEQARINIERSIMGRSGRQNSFLTSTTRRASTPPTLAARRSDYARTAG